MPGRNGSMPSSMSDVQNGMLRLEKKDDTDFVLQKKLSIPKTSRPDSAKIDQENKTYVEMVFSKLRNIKRLVSDA